MTMWALLIGVLLAASAHADARRECHLGSLVWSGSC